MTTQNRLSWRRKVRKPDPKYLTGSGTEEENRQNLSYYLHTYILCIFDRY